MGRKSAGSVGGGGGNSGRGRAAARLLLRAPGSWSRPRGRASGAVATLTSPGGQGNFSRFRPAFGWSFFVLVPTIRMAKRHPGSSRRHGRGSKHSAEADDVFVANVLEFSGWARKNSQLLILIGVALVVAIFAGVYYMNWRQGQSEMAVAELERIAQSIGQTDPEASRISLEQYIERFGGTRNEGEARLLLGQLYLDGGQPGQALETLQESSASLRDPLGVQIATLRARAMEAQSRFADAEALYLRIADQAELGFQRIGALEDAARLRMEQENYAGAVELYERLLAEEEHSLEDEGILQLRLGEARAHLSR